MTAELVRLAPTYAEIEAMRDLLAPGADDAELALFAKVCAHVQLSPFKDQIALIPRWNSRARRSVHKAQIMVAGRRTLAERTGLLVGNPGPEWCAARERDDDDLRWLDLWDRDGYPYAARCFVYKQGWIKPANGTVKWSEFAQVDKDGKLTGLWPTKPSHMLGKTAESLALRRAFPDVIDIDAFDSMSDPDYEWQPAEIEADPRAIEVQAAAREAGIDRGDEPARASAVGEPAAARADDVDVVAEPSADPSPEGQPPPLVLTQSEAHAVIGSLPKAQQLEFLKKHRVVEFALPWPHNAIVDASHIAQEPF